METQTIHQPRISASADSTDVESNLSKDEIFEILMNQRRRDAIRFLKENDGAANLSDMSEYIAARENDIEVGALSSSQRKRVYIGLYQCHLPKMANFGVIDFDKDRGTIALRPEATQLEPFLDDSLLGRTELLVAPETASQRVSVLLAIVLAIGLGAALIGFQPFAALPIEGWAIVSTLSLLSLVGMNVYTNR